MKQADIADHVNDAWFTGPGAAPKTPLARLSILIPTLNRSDFLGRALTFYHKTGFDGVIILGDSSDEQHASLNRQLVDRFGKVLRIVYHHYPNPPYIHDGMCIKDMAEVAPTPYVVYSGDDDFLVTDGLMECINFLDNNNDYIAASGTRVNLRLDRQGPYGQVDAASTVRFEQFLDDSPIMRWIRYIRTGFSTQYYVHRVETWREMYKNVDQTPSRYLGPELLPCSITAIQGKVKQLDCLTIVFQRHRDQIFSWDKTSIFKLLNDHRWAPSVATIKETITEAFRREGLTPNQAEHVFENEFWRHITGVMVNQFNAKNSGKQLQQDFENAETLRALLSDNYRYVRQIKLIIGIIGNNGN
jgi:glycosyltransferase domain-containing protein